MVLTEDDWNDTMNNSVVVLMYDELIEPGTDEELVRLGGGLVADCRRIQVVPHADFDRFEFAATEREADLVSRQVRSHLCLDQLMAKTASAPAPPTEAWFPRQGAVRWVPEDFGDEHMYVAVTSDEFNATHDYVVGARLTSRTWPRRTRWEVPCPGGYVVSGDLHVLPRADIRTNRPQGDRPDHLTVENMAELAQVIEYTLAL